ncbi:MAG: YqgE/AlgH family protein, partial [Acidimicrobiia bacterium]
MTETLAMASQGLSGQNRLMMPLAGSLLIAMPDLTDPNFSRTVLLVLEHDAGGAVGVVLNRPSELSPFNDLPAWADLVALPAVVFLGGPVEPDVAVGLAAADDES